jgi:hypothetical protein
MGLVGQGVQKGVAGVDKTLGGAMTFFKAAQDELICKADLEDAASLAIQGCSKSARNARTAHCAERAFLTTVDKAEDEVHILVDNGLTFATDISDSILSKLSAVNTTAVELKNTVTNITTGLNQIVTDSDVLSAYYSELGVPDVGDTLTAATDATVTVTDALDAMADATSTVEDEIKTALEEQLKDSLNEAKDSISESMCDVTEPLLNTQSDLDEVHDQVKSFRESLLVYENHVVAGFSCFTFFGAVLPFLFACLGSTLKGKCGRRIGCCQIFTMMTFVCFVMGFSQLFSIVIQDVCGGKELMIQTNLEGQTYQISDTTVSLPETLIKVLNCDGTDNLAGVAGAESVFDVTSQVDEVFDKIDEGLEGISSSSSNVTSSKSDIEAAKTDLDRDTSTGSYSPGILQQNITQLKELCTAGSGATKLYPSSYTLESSFTLCEFPADAVSSKCTETTQAECLKCALSDTCPIDHKCATEEWCNKKNDDAVLRADRVDWNFALVNLLKDDAITSTIPTLLNTLDDAAGSMDTIGTSVNDLRKNVTTLIDFAKGVPDSARCKFIGDFYRTSVQEGMCVDIQGSFTQIYSASALAVTTMFIGFYIMVPWLQVHSFAFLLPTSPPPPLPPGSMRFQQPLPSFVLIAANLSPRPRSCLYLVLQGEEDDGVFVQVDIGNHHAVNVNGGGFSHDVNTHKTIENPAMGSIQYVDNGVDSGDRSERGNSVGFV